MKLPVLGLALALGLGCSRGAPADQQQSKPAAAPPVKAAEPAKPVAAAHATPIVVGGQAPNGSIAQASGEKIALADVLQAHKQTVVVFYRGFY